MINQEIKSELEKILTVSNIIFDSVTEYSRQINNQMYEVLPTPELQFDSCED